MVPISEAAWKNLYQSEHRLQYCHAIHPPHRQSLILPKKNPLHAHALVYTMYHMQVSKNVTDRLNNRKILFSHFSGIFFPRTLIQPIY
jgi:hypothetical protein